MKIEFESRECLPLTFSDLKQGDEFVFLKNGSCISPVCKVVKWKTESDMHYVVLEGTESGQLFDAIPICNVRRVYLTVKASFTEPKP